MEQDRRRVVVGDTAPKGGAEPLPTLADLIPERPAWIADAVCRDVATATFFINPRREVDQAVRCAERVRPVGLASTTRSLEGPGGTTDRERRRGGGRRRRLHGAVVTRRMIYRGPAPLASALVQTLREQGIEVQWEPPQERRGGLVMRR